MPSTSPLLWSEWAFFRLNIAIQKVLWMQMRITMLDFVSFVSMAWKVKISQLRNAWQVPLCLCAGCLPHEERVPEVAWHSEEC